MIGSHNVMKLVIRIAALTLLAGSVSLAQPIRVLFWGGAVTAHNPTALKDTLLKVVGAQGMTLSYRADSNTMAPVWLNVDTLKQYDVMLVYTTNQNAQYFTQAQFNVLKQWVDSGHVIVALHGSTNTYLSNNSIVVTAWRQLLGAQFVDHGPASGNGNGGTVVLDKPGHASLTNTVMLPTSAANTGGQPYWDEGRTHDQFMNDTILLAHSVYTNPVGTRPWIWVRPQGRGWVYYNASGHDGQVWTRAEFKGQLFAALKWGASISATPLRGRAALQPLIDFYQGRIQVPFNEPHTIWISNMTGRKMFSSKDSRASSYDLSILPVGAYYVEVLFPHQESFRSLYLRKP